MLFSFKYLKSKSLKNFNHNFLIHKMKWMDQIYKVRKYTQVANYKELLRDPKYYVPLEVEFTFSLCCS